MFLRLYILHTPKAVPAGTPRACKKRMSMRKRLRLKKTVYVPETKENILCSSFQSRENENAITGCRHSVYTYHVKAVVNKSAIKRNEL
jgi:hypothetical protein